LNCAGGEPGKAKAAVLLHHNIASGLSVKPGLPQPDLFLFALANGNHRLSELGPKLSNPKKPLALSRPRSDRKRLAEWRNFPCEELEGAGQQELTNWCALAGAKSDLGMKPEVIDFVETFTLNTDSYFAVFS